MAKQISILLIALAILIFSGVWEINYLQESSNYIRSDIDAALNTLYSNNFENTKKNIKNIEDTWENMKFVWNIFVNHERIDDLEETMVELKSYVYLEDNEESIKSANKLKRIVEQIIEKQKFTAEHIL